MTVYEFDDQGYRIIGYNQGIEFYDPDRELQCEIFLGTDNRLYACGTSLGGDSDYVDLNGRYLRLDCSNDPLTSSLSIEGNVNLNKAGAELQIEGDHALSIDDTSGDRTAVIVGAGAADSVSATGTTGTEHAVVIGEDAAKSADDVQWSVIIGSNAAANGGTYNPYADTSVIIGQKAAYDVQYANDSVIIGVWACYDTSGEYNTAVGNGALYNTGTGAGTDTAVNVAVGGSALYDIANGADNNAAVGFATGQKGQYLNNCALLGAYAGQYHQTTDLENSVAVGAYALAGNWSGDCEGGDTVALGHYSCYQGTVYNSVAAGYESGYGADVIGCVFLGYQAGYSATTDNILIIENSNDISTPLIYGEFDNNVVRIHGTLEMQEAGTARTVSTADGVITSTTSVANTTAETTIFTESIAADELHAGQVVKVHIRGRYSTANATDTFTLRLKVGGTTVDSITSVAANVTDAPIDVEFVFTVRSSGAAGTLWAFARAVFDNTHNDQADTSTTALDTTAADDVTITIQWDNADAGDSVSVDQGYAEFLA